MITCDYGFQYCECTNRQYGMYYCINECQFLTFEGLSTTFEASNKCLYDTSLLILVTKIYMLVMIHLNLHTN